MHYRDLGKTGIKVSEVGFGAWAIGGNRHGQSYGPTDDKTSTEALEKAFELGCNFFDTADVYGWGHSEELIGKTFKSKRDRIVIATKGGSDFYQGYGYQTFTPDYIRFALDKSLLRLKTDYVDLYQLHNPPLSLIKSEQTFAILKDLKNEGKIRSWGLSLQSFGDGLKALQTVRPDSLQVAYNLFVSQPKEELFPLAERLGCAIIAREPLSNGFLTGKYKPNPEFAIGDIRRNWPNDFINARVKATEKLGFLARNGGRTLAQAAIQWVLNSPIVSVVIPGIKTPEQAVEAIESTQATPLTKDELANIVALQGNQFGL